jgi:hypothetical protein
MCEPALMGSGACPGSSMLPTEWNPAIRKDFQDMECPETKAITAVIAIACSDVRGPAEESAVSRAHADSQSKAPLDRPWACRGLHVRTVPPMAAHSLPSNGAKRAHLSRRVVPATLTDVDSCGSDP